MDREQIIQWGRQTSALVQEQNADVKYLTTAEELMDFAKLVAAHEREAIFDEWHSCLMSDLEHGVKSLNEKAAEEWHKNYPAQSKMFPEWLKARSNT